MAQIKFSVVGDIQLSRNLRVLTKNLRNLKGFFDESLKIVEERTDEVFQGKGKNMEKSPKWKPLSASTQKARKMRWGYYKKTPKNPSVLRWTGNLQDNRKRTVTNKSGKLQFDADYGIHHQRGSGNLPRRAVVDISNRTVAEMVRALQGKIEKAVGVFGIQV